MIIKTGDKISFSSGNFETLDKLPCGNWLVMEHPKEGFYLQKQDDFKLPDNVYGNVNSQVERYLNTFNNRDKNLGIMLSGLKGTGKSLLAKALCIASGLPVIIVTQPYTGTEFENFLSNIKQECVIFIDEFEKVYKGNNGLPTQEHLLSILDGVFEGKKIFLLTSNHMNRVIDAMKNRPSRIHYMSEYFGLTNEVINEVIDDLLVNKEHKEGLQQVLEIVGEVNMDMLVSIIQEMNMYSESAREALSYLNVKPANLAYKSEWEQVMSDGSKESFTGQVGYNPLYAEELDVYGESKSGKYMENRVVIADSEVSVSSDRIIIKYNNITYTFTKKPQFRFKF